jgi:protein-tyrosine-phosphatase
MFALVVPRRLIQERGVVRRLGDAGRMYAKLCLLNAIGIRGFARRSVPADAHSFVFVCHGNIMRSPMAELMLKRALSEYHEAGITVLSAGMHATPGTEAHPQACVAARELGLPLDRHRSRLLTEDMVTNADAVFAMDFQNLAELMTRFPRSRNKIFMLSAYAEETQRGRPIADPYFGDQALTFRCYAELQICVTNLANSLRMFTERGSSPE